METELKGVPQPPEVARRASGYGRKAKAAGKAPPGTKKLKLRRVSFARMSSYRAVSGFRFLKKIIALIKKATKTRRQGDFRNHGFKGVKGRSGRTGFRGRR